MKSLSQKTTVEIIDGLADTELVRANYDSYRFPLHFHDTFVIELIGAGIDWCCGNKLAAHTGEVFVHFPFASHTGGTTKNQRLSYQAIYPKADLVADLTGIALSEFKTPCSFVSSDSGLVREVSNFFKLARKEESRCEKSAASLTRVFDAVFNSQDYNATIKEYGWSNRSRQVMLAIKEYLLDNFSRDVTNRELSSRFELSEFHLIRQFKCCFGITPRQFLISKRVLESKRLIARGMSVASAAHSTGFSDQSHLTRQFKRITGYCPGRFSKIR